MLKSPHYSHEYWMRRALTLAEQAMCEGEIPVGAVIVLENECIAEGRNQPIRSCDPTAHAEIVVLRQAALKIKNYRLPGATLYVTLEPCLMCAGAIIHARLSGVVFGAYDPKTGAAGSRFDILRDTRHNHQLACVGGVLAEPCGEQLKQFFLQRRIKAADKVYHQEQS